MARQPPEDISKLNILKDDAAAAAAKSLQSCPTLCDPIDASPLGSPVPGILQARTLEWVAISFSMELQIKTMMRYYYTPIKITKIQNMTTWYAGKDVG